MPQPDRAWTVTAGAFPDADGAERLNAVLASTPARDVQVPVLHALPGGGTLARWETVARRKRGAGVQRLHAPLQAPPGKGDATRRTVLEGDAAQALPMLRADLARSRGAAQGVAARWVVLALLRSGDPQGALALAVAALAAAPDHADLARLGAVRAATVGDLDTAQALADLAGAVGTGARYDEWFVTLPL